MTCNPQPSGDPLHSDAGGDADDAEDDVDLRRQELCGELRRSWPKEFELLRKLPIDVNDDDAVERFFDVVTIPSTPEKRFFAGSESPEDDVGVAGAFSNWYPLSM